MISDPGKVFHPPASYEDDGVFLQIVAFTTYVRCDLYAVSQPDARHLAKRRVRLLRRNGLYL